MLESAHNASRCEQDCKEEEKRQCVTSCAERCCKESVYLYYRRCVCECVCVKAEVGVEAVKKAIKVYFFFVHSTDLK